MAGNFVEMDSIGLVIDTRRYSSLFNFTLDLSLGFVIRLKVC